MSLSDDTSDSVVSALEAFEQVIDVLVAGELELDESSTDYFQRIMAKACYLCGIGSKKGW